MGILNISSDFMKRPIPKFIFYCFLSLSIVFIIMYFSLIYLQTDFILWVIGWSTEANPDFSAILRNLTFVAAAICGLIFGTWRIFIAQQQLVGEQQKIKLELRTESKDRADKLVSHLRDWLITVHAKSVEFAVKDRKKGLNPKGILADNDYNLIYQYLKDKEKTVKSESIEYRNIVEMGVYSVIVKELKIPMATIPSFDDIIIEDKTITFTDSILNIFYLSISVVPNAPDSSSNNTITGEDI